MRTLAVVGKQSSDLQNILYMIFRHVSVLRLLRCVQDERRKKQPEVEEEENYP
jgi:hypothetical protein